MNLITFENICKSYSEKKLIENLSFGINDGEKIGLIGVNGTGKSTLLKIVAGAEEIDSGKITKANRVYHRALTMTKMQLFLNRFLRLNHKSLIFLVDIKIY